MTSPVVEPAPPDPAALLDALLTRAPLAIYTYDSSGRVQFLSGALLSTLGLEASALLGTDVFERYADDPGRRSLLSAPLDGRTVQYQFVLGDAVLSAWIAPLDGVDGSRVALGVCNDVTEQVLAERGRELYRSFVDAAPQFIALAGLDGAVRYVNPAGRRLVGMPDDVDVSRTTIGDYLTPEGLTLSTEREQPAIVAEGSYAGESTLRHWPTGSRIPVHVDSFLMRSPGTGEPTAMGTVQTDLREVVAAREALEDALARQRGLIVHLHEAQESERRRVAADVHDDTLQVMAGANLRLQSLRSRLEAAGQTDLAGVAEQLDREMRDASHRLRKILFDLEPPRQTSTRDMSDRLRDYARAVFEGTSTEVRVDVPADLDVPPMVGQLLYRIAQQALTNAARHAAASHVAVVMQAEGSSFTLGVTDDGRGLPRAPFVPQTGRGGLRSMVDRAESAGGTCVVTAGPGGVGTAVAARVPSRIGDVDAAENRASTRAFLEQTMESINEGFAALDNDWRYVYVNRIGEQAMGRGPGELIGRVVWDEFALDEATKAAYKQARAEMRPVTVEAWFEPWRTWFESRIYPSESGLSVFFRDITAQKQQEIVTLEQAAVIETGGRVLAALQSEPSLDRALARAVEALREGWLLAGVRLVTAERAGRPSVVVTAGDVESAGLATQEMPLTHGQQPLGTITLYGDRRGGHDELLQLFSLRLAAG